MVRLICANRNPVLTLTRLIFVVSRDIVADATCVLIVKIQ